MLKPMKDSEAFPFLVMAIGFIVGGFSTLFGWVTIDLQTFAGFTLIGIGLLLAAITCVGSDA